MSRKLILLIPLLLASVLMASALGAEAKSVGSSQRSGLSIVAKQASILTHNADVGGEATSDKGEASEPSSLGYYLQAAVNIGNSAFDHQTNDRMQRQIAMGSGNWIHNVYMFRGTGGGNRTVKYVGYKLGNAPGVAANISPVSGGYGAVSVNHSLTSTPGTITKDSIAMVAFHYTKSGTTVDDRSRMQIGRQASAGSTSFSLPDYPVSADIMPDILNCQGIITGMGSQEGGYIWPVIAGDYDGSAMIAHVLATENRGVEGTGSYDTTGRMSLVYFKTPADLAAPTATCGQFLDSVALMINYDVAASPVSNKVAAVYLYPRSWKNPPHWNIGTMDNVVYKESNDLGATWGTRTKITDYSDSEYWISDPPHYFLMAAKEVSALYTDDDCLHVLWNTMWRDTASEGGTYWYLKGWSRLYHWSSCNPTCTELLNDGASLVVGSGCNLPFGHVNISKIGLSECSIGGQKRLYAIYTMFPDSTRIVGNTHADCSIGGYANGDVVAQGATDISGEFWGAPVNITNTNSNGCAAGSCMAEVFPSAAPYVNDSIRVQYMRDRDAGDYTITSAGSPEGSETLNNIYNYGYVCYAITMEAILAVDPDSVVYPWHTIPGGQSNEVVLTFTNTGTASAAYTRTITYNPSVAGWLTFKKAATGTIPAGCVQTMIDTVRATGPATEGIYRATITYSYTGSKTLTIPVELYNYTAPHWFVEDNNTLRTAALKMLTAQNSRVSAQRAGLGFKYFSDGADTNYMYDGSLLLGTSNTTISMGIYTDSAGISGHGDALIGRLFCTSNMAYDTLPGSQHWGYRKSYGVGCNKDSSIAFDAEFYAPRHVDSGNFLVGKFMLYAGPKNPSATINNVTVAYAADWDVPDDSSQNTAGYDEALQMVYQRGVWGNGVTRFASLAGVRGDDQPLDYGMVLDNPSWVYRLRGYVHDTIWTKIQTTADYEAYDGLPVDLNSMLVFSKTATIRPKAASLFTVYVIFAGQPKNGNLANLKTEIQKAQKFICTYLAPSLSICAASCDDCGDANSDGRISIADAIFLVLYMFAGCPPPADCNYSMGMGDANGDQTVNISDAVYLMSYIFSGGSAPHCYGGGK